MRPQGGKLVDPVVAPALGGMDPCLPFQEVEECWGKWDVGNSRIVQEMERDNLSKPSPQVLRFGSTA